MYGGVRATCTGGRGACARGSAWGTFVGCVCPWRACLGQREAAELTMPLEDNASFVSDSQGGGGEAWGWGLYRLLLQGDGQSRRH